MPKNSLDTTSAVTEAIRAGKMAREEKFFWISSSPNISPARGALKAAASPAQAPQVSR